MSGTTDDTTERRDSKGAKCPEDMDPCKLEEAPDPSKVGTLKYPLLTHEKVDTRPTRNINMKQYLCVKQSLPKTRMTNAILYENVSQERHLEMKMTSIAHRKGRTSNIMDITKRAFVAQQDRKRRKWKREDEVRLSGMNLPSLSPVQLDRCPSVEVMYHSTENQSRGNSATTGRKPILPMMKFRKERTEIVLHNDKTFITKLPAFVEVDHNVQTVFDAYRGKAYLSRDLPSRDERFIRLETLLQPSSGTREEEAMAQNTVSKRRALKYKTESPVSSEPLPVSFAESRVLIASRGKSRDNLRSAPSVDYVTEKKSATLRRADILHSFKTQDIKELAKSLTREVHINPDNVALTKPRKDSATSISSRRKSSIQHVPCLGLKYEMKHT